MFAGRLTLVLALATGSLLAQAHWTLLYPAQSPPGREDHAMAFHATTGSTILFGGRNVNTFYSDTWAFDGNTWTVLPAAGPSPRQGHKLVADEARGTLLLFGGHAGGGPCMQETWQWTGTGWLQLALAIQPSGRIGHAMAYDRERLRVVLFGGDDISAVLGDTWEWDGQSWQAVTTAVAPPPRSGTAMAFDPNLGRVLLFGGSSSSPNGSFDTWSWDGATWTWHQVGNPPTAHIGHAMITDPVRRRVVMWGGSNWSPQLWEWDGSTWDTEFLLPPTPRNYPRMAYDAVRDRAVMFGGRGFADTWIYATDDLAVFEPVGPGCAGTSGTPELTNVPYSYPWVGDTFETMVEPTPPSALTIFATGAEAPGPIALDPYGMPGCSLFLSEIASELKLATPAGRATWSLAIPNDPGLAGAELAQQVLVLDPAANTAGAVMSSAGRFVVGIR